MATQTTKNTASSKNVNGSAKHGAPKAAPKPALKAVPATEKPASSEREQRLPIARRMQQNVARFLKRWDLLVRKTKGWSAEVDVSMAEARDSIDAASQGLAKLPDSFKPTKGTGGGANKSPLTVGSFVSITEKATKRYKGILDDGDMVNLEVVKADGVKFIFKTQSGDRVIIPRGHVRPVEKPAAKKQPAEEVEA